MTDFDVLVIGGGQAGLATAYWLRRLGQKFVVLEALDRPGERWRKRYASLTLFTPREFSSLPGLPIQGIPSGYASAVEFADYLELYAAKYELPVRTNQPVVRLARSETSFVASLQSGEQVSASTVIVATGGFQLPVIPTIATELSPGVQQLTADAYHSPADVISQSVLVVGDGATGRDIAADLGATHRVTLACGRQRRLLPETFLGLSTWKWLKALGLLNAAGNSPVGRFMRKAEPFPNRQRELSDLRRMGIDIRPRATSVTGWRVGFADGGSLEAQAVVWALGYRDDTSWVDIPGAVDAEGSFLHFRGRSPVPGLYFVGRPWQRNRASALIMGVGSDARLIAAEVAEPFGHDTRIALEQTLRPR
jgi:putative flavoprotein involved in K+ transport